MTPKELNNNICDAFGQLLLAEDDSEFSLICDNFDLPEDIIKEMLACKNEANIIYPEDFDDSNEVVNILKTTDALVEAIVTWNTGEQCVLIVDGYGEGIDTYWVEDGVIVDLDFPED